ncbi:MAG: hypothetical protein LWY06_01680 [Firmicutes bacterium]|nr:hypothetical protein [Bacillota bacterium]
MFDLPQKTNRKRGYTLAELLAYLSVFLIIMIFSGSFVINSLRYYRLLETETTLQQKLMTSLTTVSKELSIASLGSLIIEKDGIIFASPADENGSFSFGSGGSLYMRKWVCIYLTGTGDVKKLVRKEIPINPPVLTPGTPPFSTVAEFSTQPVYERLVASEAKSFTVENDGIKGGYTVKLILTHTTDTTKPSEIEGETGIFIRN